VNYASRLRGLFSICGPRPRGHQSELRSILAALSAALKSNVNITTYLHRIGYEGPLAPNAETLRNLQVAHLLTVPFENLDISLGRAIVLDRDRFYTKIVEHGRGGFCYELNGLFASLLNKLGFEVSLLSARVCDGKIIAEFDHLALLVNVPGLSGSWLADVGFGDGFLEPLQLIEDLEQPQGGATYRLSRDAHRWFNARRDKGGDWSLAYDFTLQPHQLEEFAGMCHYHQTSPDSHFTKRRICSRATPTGRITLADMRLIRTTNGVREERLLRSEDESQAALRKYFNIVL
jgi:N-hydroxyarylamine O-acetyltransferase